jgi:ferric-dicitrate binding protein FerR (iron transport regulator)
MTPNTPQDEYLWDRSGPIDPAVADLEARLAPLRFDRASHPLVLPRPRRRLPRALVVAGAIAASLLVAAGAWYEWRFDWTRDRAWRVTVEPAVSGGSSTTASLAVGKSLQTIAPASPARIDIARVGVMDAAAGTDLMISSTDAHRHRVRLDRGTVDVRLWAPPSVVAFRTPAGDVIDLGCVFQLAVDDGVTRLDVRTGWVQLGNSYGESLVPAGASSVMRAGSRPSVPVYDDAPPAFAGAVRAFEIDDPTGAALSSIVATSRPRDVLTVLMLAARRSGPVRATLVARAAVLAPPPATANIAAIFGGDNDALWRWIDSLPLPPVKSWWRNWRDALPPALAR